MKHTLTIHRFHPSTRTLLVFVATPFVVWLFAACDSVESDLDSGLSSPTSAFGEVARQNSTILAKTEADTVWLWKVDDAATTVWTSGGKERWRSEYAYGTDPHVELTPIDQDTILDLFWTVDESGGPVGGIVLLASEERVRTPFVSPANACLPPILTDVNRDRRPDVVHFAPGLVEADSCRTFSYASCEERYATEWRQAFLQLDGDFRADESLAPAFYQQTSMLYLHSAGRLQRVLTAIPTDSSSSQVCDSSMVAGLMEMSQRAAQASGRTSFY